MKMKPLGVDFLFVRKIESTGEWGIYKGLGKNGLLLLVYPDLNEAVVASEEISRVIKVKVQKGNEIQSIV